MGRKHQSKKLRRANPGESRDHSFARKVAYSAAPAGVVQAFAGASLPDGWLWCRGGTFDRYEYPDLYAVLGTTSLPDYRGRTLIGAGTGSGLTNRSLGADGGAEDVTLSVAQMPTHGHTASSGSTGSHDHATFANRDTNTSQGGEFNRLTGLTTTSGTAPEGATSTAGAHSHTVTIGNAGGGDAHNNMMPWAAVNYIIRG